MYSVYVEEMSGKAQTYNDVSNLSVTGGRILIVKNNRMISFRPGDLIEVRFCWVGYTTSMVKGGDTE